MSEQQVVFNPRAHLMQIGRGDKAQDYLPVQYRLVWVNDVVDRAVADGQDVKLDIDTEEIDCDLDKEFSAEVFVWNNEKRRSEKVLKTEKGYAKYKATVTLQIGNMIKRASATKSERAVDFPDFIEKANTGAVGRALAMIGFGTQFAPEFDEGSRIVDAPVDHEPPASINNTTGSPRNEPRKTVAPTSNTVTVADNTASQSQPQEDKQLSLEERFRLLFKRAFALRQFTFKQGASDQEKRQAFLKFAGTVVDATLTSTGQLTASRLDIIEAYLNAKDAA